jgi:hypothetical protein
MSITQKTMQNKFPTFKPDVCDHCTQTKNYDIPLGRGDAMMTLALYNAVREKNLNRVHINKEMVVDPREFPSYKEMVNAGRCSHRMEGNISRLHRHGLAAMDDKDAGVWILTPKAGDFLFRNEAIARVAIVSKVTGHQEGYFNGALDRVTFGDLMKKEVPWWNIKPFGWDSGGRIHEITDMPTLFGAHV